MAFTAALACLGGMAQLKALPPRLCTPMKPTEKLKIELRTSSWVLPADVSGSSSALRYRFPYRRPLIATLPPIGREWCAAAPPLAPTPPRALTSAAFGAGGGFVQRAVGSGRLGAADG